MDEKKPVTAEADSADDKGAVESDVQRIREIKGGEVLGYQGEGREEHSGESGENENKGDGLEDDLADNGPGQAGSD